LNINYIAYILISSQYQMPLFCQILIKHLARNALIW
jgi:hypothetical protein